MSVPLSLVLEQGPMIKTQIRIYLSAVFPHKRPSSNPSDIPVVRRHLPAPSRRLVRNYADWCGAPKPRYIHRIPPHLFTQFALPVWSVQLEMTRYSMIGIINQGCGLTVHEDIAVGDDLELTSALVRISEDETKARLHQQLTIASSTNANAIEVDFYSTFLLGKRPGRSRTAPTDLPAEKVATWDAHAWDGFRFGILTGDLNPIHWIGPVARLSPFRAKIMPGFGMFARCFEILQNTTNEIIRRIDVRFVRSAPLPSRGLQIRRNRSADRDGSRQLALLDAAGHVLMAGRYTGA